MVVFELQEICSVWFSYTIFTDSNPRVVSCHILNKFFYGIKSCISYLFTMSPFKMN